MARPRKRIDQERLEALASRMCTNEEMAAELGCSADTLERRFAGTIKRGHERAKLSLRAKQFEVAMGRPPQPAIYLRENQDDPKSPLVLRDGKPVLLLEAQEAVKPNVTMLIFLGKQYLEQSDKVSFEEGDGFEFVK